MAYSQNLPLPQNTDAERALLGAILENNDALFDANQVLAGEDFYEPWNANAYNLLRDVIEPGGRVSAATLLHDLSQNAIVGSDLTAQDVVQILLREAAPRSEVATLAETIHELWRRREAIAAFERGIEDLRGAGASVPASEIVEKLDVQISALYSGVESFGIRRLPEVGDAVIADLGRQMNDDDREVGVPHGLASLESLVGSFLPGKLYVLAGSSGAGKSALAQQLCEYAAAAGNVTLLFEHEMTAEEVATRTLTARTGISGAKMARANINDKELARLFEENEKIRQMPMFVDDSPGLTALAIKAKMLRFKRIVGLELAAVDHLQYVEKPDRRMSDVEAVGPNLRVFKQAAKELNIPILVLAQLKAGFSEGPLRRPTISDLWNSSAVEQNADAVFFVHRPEYMLHRKEPMKDSQERGGWESQVLEWKGKAELILGKLRQGKGYGIRTIGFDEERTRFVDNERDVAPATIDPNELPF